jgi:DNA-binding transcriptional MerR regulator
VPADQFGVALDEIKKLATNVPEEKATGQDVTEEFIDLEARIKTQKALEAQFLGIMRQANKVEDALEVQRQIADVRTEIERLEGRKRFIENRSSLATITVNIQAPKPVLVTTPTGVGHSLREAVSESVEVASGLLIFFVRFAIVMVPVLLFLGLPTALVVRYFMRRAKRVRLAQALATPAAE